MPKIKWKGIIWNPSDYQMGFLSKNAKKLNMPKTLNEMMIKALPFVIPSILIIFIAMFLKTKNASLVPKQFAAVALASYPLKRDRFILMCLLPYLLGVIPIILFCISPATAIEINGFLFGLSIMGLTSPYVDSYNVYQVLKQTSKSNSLQFYGDDLYVISEEP